MHCTFEIILIFKKDQLGNIAYVGLSNGKVIKCLIQNKENIPVLTLEENEKLQFESKLSEEKEELPVVHM